MSEPDSRRPIKTRAAGWAKALAARLSRSGITPNQISVAGLVFALLAALLCQFGVSAALFLAAACVQLRLLCNMLDGMVAVEGGKKAPDGDLYNELPDRLEDVLILVGLGYAAGSGFVPAGWTAALSAVLSAYVRALGASLGGGQDFSGLFSKPRRMFCATLFLLFAGVLPEHASAVLGTGVIVIAAGTLWTVAARTRNLRAKLHAAAFSSAPSNQ